MTDEKNKRDKNNTDEITSKDFTISQVFKVFKFNIILLIFLYILNEFSTIFSPYLMTNLLKSIEEFYNGSKSFYDLMKINGITTCIWSTWILINMIVKINGGNLFNKIEIYIKKQLFNFIQSISYENFVKITSEKAFNYLKLLEYSIKEIFTIVIVDMFANIFSIIINIIILFRIIPELGFLIFFWGIFHFTLLAFFFSKTTNNNKNFLDKKSKVVNNLLESFLNVLMIKTNNTLAYEKKKLNDISSEYEKSYQQFLFNSEKFNTIALIICEVFLWGGGFIVIANNINKIKMPISLITYIFIINYNIVSKVKNIGIKISKLFEHLGEYENIYKFFSDYKINRGESCNLLEIKEKYENEITPIIEFENVHMFYENNQILKNINFKIYKGERVCFIGSSGSGKSTIVNLLCGIYKNYSGNIYINGHNINNVRREDIINILSIVNQSFILFTRTIRENLIQDRNISEDKILHYSKIAAIDEFINEQPDKYDTIINSKRISGGQAQRICLARMLIREKPIKIFDEATNGLDIKNKQLFLDNILDNKYAYNYDSSEDTLLFVDHSLEFLHKMSKVILLNNGEIILNDSYENIKNHPSFLSLQKFIMND